MIKNNDIKNLISFLLLAIIFIIISIIVKQNIEPIKSFIGSVDFIIGASIYILIAFITTVIAPLSSVPFMLIASNAWGWQVTGILSFFSWSLGSLAAFFIAVKFGKPLIKKFVSLDKLEKYERRMPKENIFWTIVLLRVLIPVDILSYALGIFTKVSYKVYMSATMLGIMPGAFILAYIGIIDIKKQIILFISFSILASLMLLLRQKTPVK